MIASAGGVGGNENGGPPNQVPPLKKSVSTPIPLESHVRGAEGLGLTVCDGTENLHISLYALAVKRDASQTIVVKPAPGEDAKIILLKDGSIVDETSYRLDGRMFGTLVQAASISALKKPFLGKPFEGEVRTDDHMKPGIDLNHATLIVSYRKDDPQSNLTITLKKPQ